MKKPKESDFKIGEPVTDHEIAQALTKFAVRLVEQEREALFEQAKDDYIHTIYPAR